MAKRLLKENWFQILAIFCLSISGTTLGVLFSWTSPSIPILISEDYPGNITLEQASYLTVLPPFASIFGSFFFSSIMDKIGRKKAILFMAIPHLLSWALIISAESIYIFYLSRLVNGFTDACMFIVMPTYVSEITTPKVRGTWGNVPTIAIYFGQFLVCCVGGYFSIKITAYIFITLPLVFFVSFITMPESPYYLIMKNRVDEARKSLQTLRRRQNVEEELKQLVLDVERQTSERGNWKDLFVNATHRKALSAGVFIRCAQQFSGLAAFNTYTVYLFQQAGNEMSPTISSIIYFFLLTSMNGAGSFFLDKLGRRLGMILSSAGCAVTLITITIYFYLSDYSSVDMSTLTWIPVTLTFLFVIIFGFGLGIVPTLIIGELFSASVKAKGVCVLNIAFALCLMVVTKLYQYFTENLGRFSPFLLFGICCVISTVASFYIVPETKGKTLEEIQQSMKSKEKELKNNIDNNNEIKF